MVLSCRFKGFSMTKVITFLFMFILLVSCASPSSITQSIPMSATEFRVAAEERIFWRDPNVPANSSNDNWIKAKVLGFNDFHGNLNSRDIGGRPAGGAAVLAAYLKAEADEVNDRVIIVHAGDMVGASPPVSALLHHEPSIEFLNLLANTKCTQRNLMAPDCNMVGTLGNHEFDAGQGEIFRLLNGGRHADVDSMAKDWAGVNVPYVSANIIDEASGETILPPYVIKKIDGVEVAIIGAVVKNTPKHVAPKNVVGLEFIDEAAAINRYVAELKAKNVHAIIVALHQGLRQVTFGEKAVVGKGELTGDIIDIIKALDGEVDIVISGHSHGYTNLLVTNNSGEKILLTQAFWSGTAYDDIDITLDPASGDIIEKSASIVTTWADAGPGLSPDPDIALMVEKANLAVKPLVSRKVGTAAVDISRWQNEAGESSLGNFITDNQRTTMRADFSFAGPSGNRENIYSGDILWGNLLSVKPFGNDLVAMTLTGEQIIRLLNQQWADREYDVILQVSGLSYTWDANLPLDDRIVEVRDAMGCPLDLKTSYRVAIDSYLASGGSDFSVFEEGIDRVVGPTDIDALVAYIENKVKPIEAHIEGRIKRLN
jgi:5'-nucleotidase